MLYAGYDISQILAYEMMWATMKKRFFLVCVILFLLSTIPVLAASGWGETFQKPVPIILADIFLSIFITISVYSLPIIVYRFAIRRKPVEKGGAIIIVFAYGIMSYIAMTVIKGLIGNGGTPGPSFYLWCTINYYLLATSRRGDELRNKPFSVEQSFAQEPEKKTTDVETQPKAENLVKQANDIPNAQQPAEKSLPQADDFEIERLPKVDLANQDNPLESVPQSDLQRNTSRLPSASGDIEDESPARYDRNARSENHSETTSSASVDNTISYNEETDFLALMISMAAASGDIKKDEVGFCQELNAFADEIGGNMMRKVAYDYILRNEKHELEWVFKEACHWAIYAGIGAVLEWKHDKNSARKNGLIKRLTDSKGINTMEHYVNQLYEDEMRSVSNGGRLTAISSNLSELVNHYGEVAYEISLKSCADLSAQEREKYIRSNSSDILKKSYYFGVILGNNILMLKRDGGKAFEPGLVQQTASADEKKSFDQAQTHQIGHERSLLKSVVFVIAVLIVAIAILVAINHGITSDKQEDAPKNFNLGIRYYDGDGVDKNYTEAVKCFRKSAKHGYAQAQYYLGLCYAMGNGVPKDDVEAAKWYRMAAEQGDADAQFKLGACYYNGYGVSKDYAEAIRWFRKAAEQGDAWAQFNLGTCYYKSNGVPQDYAEAANWFMKATRHVNAFALNNLGACYENGNGVSKDYAEAVKWYRKAAAQGNEEAKNRLVELGEY